MNEETNTPLSSNEDLAKKVENLLGPTPEEAPPQAEQSLYENHISIDDQGKLDQSQSPELETPEPVAVKPPKDPPTEEQPSSGDSPESEQPTVEHHEHGPHKAVVSPKGTHWERFKNFVYRTWNNPKKRWSIIIGTLVIVFAGLGIPASRYFVLNNFGVRSSLSVTVLDDSTKLPLKKVSVRLGTVSKLSDESGKVKLEHIKLGSQTLTISKRAFAPVNQHVTIGWGSNPLGDFKLNPVGTQYAFVVTDYLSGKPIAKAEATAGEASALSDNDGKILLTIAKEDAAKDQDVTITADGMRDETAHIGATTSSEQPIHMVPAHKLAFVSKRSGKYDLYKIDADGKNEAITLAGTGRERTDLALIPHPSANMVAFVSTRDSVYNKDGYLLSTLTLVDLTDDTTTRVVQSERVQLLGWVGDKLVFVQIAAGASAASPQRYRLTSYDYKKDEKKDLAFSNYFNDVQLSNGVIYYAPSASYQKNPTENFYKINPDGSGKQTVLNQDVFNIFRTDFDKFVLYIDNGWYDYTPGDKPMKLSSEPSNQQNRVYVDNAKGDKSLWVDNRDGKGVLIVYDTKSKTEKTLKSQSGIKNPIYWLNNTSLVYRVNTDQETADYVVSLNGGDPKKVRDVTATTGMDQWYYY